MGTLESFLLLLLAVAKVVSSEVLFCEDYIRCMEQLEVKQHECLALDRNVRLRNSDACGRRKWDKKIELNALHMRRAEVARDCVQRNHLDSQIAESTLNEETRKQCTSIHEKFQFAKNISMTSSSSSVSRKKRMAKRNKREAKRNTNSRAAECRNAAKVWHKQCSALAKCCPLTDECKQSTTEIMEQIFEGRRKLQEMHDTHCL